MPCVARTTHFGAPDPGEPLERPLVQRARAGAVSAGEAGRWAQEAGCQVGQGGVCRMRPSVSSPCESRFASRYTC
eukprot:13763229-Heterocapsa_arctica.AAC.1